MVLPVIAVALVLFEFNPTHYGFYPRCLLYVTTGIYCPGCGATRAAYERQLTHGHLVTALRDKCAIARALPFFALFCSWLLVSAQAAGAEVNRRAVTALHTASALDCGRGGCDAGLYHPAKHPLRAIHVAGAD